MWMLCDDKCAYLDYDLDTFFPSCFFSRLRIQNIPSEIHSLSSPIHAARNQLSITLLLHLCHVCCGLALPPCSHSQQDLMTALLDRYAQSTPFILEKKKCFWLKTAMSLNIIEIHSIRGF